APGQVGPKGLTALFEQLFIFSAIGFWIDRFARNRGLRDTMAHTQPEMQADKGKHYPRENENMDCEEATKRGAADAGSAEDNLRQPIANQRHPACLFGRDHDRPCGG